MVELAYVVAAAEQSVLYVDPSSVEESVLVQFRFIQSFELLVHCTCCLDSCDDCLIFVNIVKVVIHYVFLQLFDALHACMKGVFSHKVSLWHGASAARHARTERCLR